MSEECTSLYIIMFVSITTKMSAYAQVPSATNCCMIGPMPHPSVTASQNLAIVRTKRRVSNVREMILQYEGRSSAGSFVAHHETQ